MQSCSQLDPSRGLTRVFCCHFVFFPPSCVSAAYIPVNRVVPGCVVFVSLLLFFKFFYHYVVFIYVASVPQAYTCTLVCVSVCHCLIPCLFLRVYSLPALACCIFFFLVFIVVVTVFFFTIINLYSVLCFHFWDTLQSSHNR